MKRSRVFRMSLAFAIVALIVFCITIQFVNTQAERELLNQTLICAISMDQTAEVKNLLDRGANPNTRIVTNDKPTSLWERIGLLFGSVRNGNRDKTALMIAAEDGKIGMVTALLNHGADPNLKDDVGYTALIRAAYYKYPYPIIEALIEHGADVNLQIDKHSTALSIVSYHAGRKSADLLIRAGAKGTDLSRR